MCDGAGWHQEEDGNWVPVQKAEAAWAEALEWLGAKEQEAESVSDSAVPQFWGP